MTAYTYPLCNSWEYVSFKEKEGGFKLVSKSVRRIFSMVLAVIITCSSLVFASGNDYQGHWAEGSMREVAIIMARLLNLKEMKHGETIIQMNDLPATWAQVIDLLEKLLSSQRGQIGIIDTKEISWETVEAAYNYCLPLVIMNATKDKITNTTTSTGSQAPINQLAHAKGLANAKSLDVVTPNTDTIYSQAFLDLKDTAMVLVKPKVDRFVTIQVMDAYTNTVKILGTGNDTQDERIYLFTGPDYHGQIPSHMVQVSMPQNTGWILGRTLCKGVDDVDNVQAIQKQFRLLPLEDYLIGGTYTPAQGIYNEKYDFIPVNHVLQMTPQEFFDTANVLMLANPPAEVDHQIMNLMKTINVGPGKTFDPNILGKDRQAKWENMIANLGSTLTKECQHFNVNIGSWKYLGKPISEFGREYTYRALVSLGGLGANPVYAAIYTRVERDEEGNPLKGSQNYTIHFETDGLPKTYEHGFWSITAYNGSNFLIDNPLNRYDINDRDNLKFNEDGSLDILVQTDAPTDDTMINNWLPVSKDDFHLYMRIYLPHEDVLSGRWRGPIIQGTDPRKL